MPPWVSMIDPNSKVFVTKEKFKRFRNMTQFAPDWSGLGQGMPQNGKPRGLWYACGSSWVDWLRDVWPEDIQEIRYVYRIEVNEKVLKITSEKDFDNFIEKYSHQDIYIDWSKVQGDGYAGIEICPPDFYATSDWTYKWWFSTWDVSSGCVWNNRGVSNIVPLWSADGGPAPGYLWKARK